MNQMIVFSILVLFLMFPLANAQQTYTQPMYATHWTTHTLLVNVPDSPAFVKQTFAVEMQNWNHAQEWFLASYYPQDQSDRFTFEMATASQQAQVTVKYVSSIPNSPPGVTGITLQDGAVIEIVLTSGTYPTSGLLVEHELGHVLGLGDNSIGDRNTASGDLMFMYLGDDYPSTLDLYAVYLQAKCQCYTSSDLVSLPNQIPYSTWNGIAVPEFPVSTPAVILSLVLIAVILRRRC